MKGIFSKSPSVVAFDSKLKLHNQQIKFRKLS